VKLEITAYDDGRIVIVAIPPDVSHDDILGVLEQAHRVVRESAAVQHARLNIARRN